jgi:hypothetical protein
MTFSIEALNSIGTAQARYKEDLSTIQWLTDGAKHVFEECCCDELWTKTIKTKSGDQVDSHVLSTTVTCFNLANLIIWTIASMLLTKYAFLKTKRHIVRDVKMD